MFARLFGSPDLPAVPEKMSGWGFKLGGIVKNWKRRWFSLRDNVLYYCVKEQGKEQGRINISEAKLVIRAPDCPRQPAFMISIPGVRVYYIVPDTDAEVSAWINVLQPLCTVDGPPTSVRISLDDFEVIRLIGAGTSGTVQLVRNKKDGILYALKTQSKANLKYDGDMTQVLNERNVLVRTVHPFLVGAHFTFQTETDLIMVLDYVPGGELLRRLDEEQRFTEPQVKIYAAQLVLGIGHLQSLGFVYRDLKPENILFDRDGFLRITDFGIVKPGMTSSSTTTGTFCGTIMYMAPEIFRHQPYTRSVDWWSLGIVVWEMLTGQPPFCDSRDDEDVISDMVRNKALGFPPYMTPVARDFLSKLLSKDPGARLGGGDGDWKEIQAHEFFSGVDWVKVERKEVDPGWRPKLAGDTDTSNFAEIDEEGPTPIATMNSRMNVDGFTFVPDE
jgi:serine/threonine protein kinase